MDLASDSMFRFSVPVPDALDSNDIPKWIIGLETYFDMRGWGEVITLHYINRLPMHKASVAAFIQHGAPEGTILA